MSFAFIVSMMLLGFSVATAFVLQPSEEELASHGSPGSRQRCQAESLQSIRSELLAALGLRAEPQLPDGALDDFRESWRTTFGAASQRAEAAAAVPVSGCSVTPDGGSQCCPVVTEVSMKDLGWDSWVIHPPSLTVVHCGLSDPLLAHVQDSDPQVPAPCCQPTTKDSVPIVYVDGSFTVVISSMQLTRGCGCAAAAAM